jgi:hypothetical protein
MHVIRASPHVAACHLQSPELAHVLVAQPQRARPTHDKRQQVRLGRQRVLRFRRIRPNCRPLRALRLVALTHTRTSSSRRLHELAQSTFARGAEEVELDSTSGG